MQVGIVQTNFSSDSMANFKKVLTFIEEAKQQGAQVILLPELFLDEYFCKTQSAKFYDLALEEHNHYLLEMQKICQKLQVAIPFPFFEKSGPNYFNSIAMIDADGKNLGTYRKSHIPDGLGYQEKFYFRPGNTGFKVFATKYGKVGVGICWDQWFPEAARIMTLMGAEILLYPTAIGSEPENPGLQTKKPWQRVMQGHAVANMIPIAAANRIGVEEGQTFYGGSFIADEFGELLCEMGPTDNGFKIVDVDIARANANRNSFGFFRDRRVDLYDELKK